MQELVKKTDNDTFQAAACRGVPEKKSVALKWQHLCIYITALNAMSGLVNTLPSLYCCCTRDLLSLLDYKLVLYGQAFDVCSYQ